MSAANVSKDKNIFKNNDLGITRHFVDSPIRVHLMPGVRQGVRILA